MSGIKYSYDESFANAVAKKCYKLYEKLGKRGKPIEGKEWTSLAAIVVEDLTPLVKLGPKTVEEHLTNLEIPELEVVALGTGTKCLGEKSLDSEGSMISDSHAEVIARRAFMKYVYNEIKLIRKGGNSDLFLMSGLAAKKFTVKKGCKFHFFTSHVPCGDASIIPILEGDKSLSRGEESGNFGNIRKQGMNQRKVVQTGEKQNSKLKKLMTEEEHNKMNKCGDINFAENSGKSQDHPGLEATECADQEKMEEMIGESDQIGKMVVDVHRTGAKCLPWESRKDPDGGNGAGYHITGAVRTKPGRGDPTLSLSCSDKLARWIYQGLQGSLLGILLEEPILLSSVIVGGGGQFSYESLRRALIDRWYKCGTGSRNKDIMLLRSQLAFKYSRNVSPSIAVPCPSSLIYTNIKYDNLEVCIEGRKQGCTKKVLAKGKGNLTISRKTFFSTFIDLLPEFSEKTYREAKEANKNYQREFDHFKNLMGAWSVKPLNLKDFKVS